MGNLLKVLNIFIFHHSSIACFIVLIIKRGPKYKNQFSIASNYDSSDTDRENGIWNGLSLYIENVWWIHLIGAHYFTLKERKELACTNSCWIPALFDHRFLFSKANGQICQWDGAKIYQNCPIKLQAAPMILTLRIM